MQKRIIILLLIISSFKIQASTLSGVIKDEKGNALSFASVYIKGTTNGVTANMEGKYTLQLRHGNYIIVFAYVGYEKKEESVAIGDNPVTLNMVMKLANVSLKGVTIYSNAEDPAYRIIRAAIKRRKHYLDQADEWSCKVYIKCVQEIDSLPSSIMGIKIDSKKVDSSKFGIIYLAESESNYYFQKPDNRKEVMISSKVSGDNKSFAWNTANAFAFNFYKNLLGEGMLSARGFVSPISETALLYYRYKLIGNFYEDGELVDKIQVIPRRESDPVFRGYIYIAEDGWRIHSTDLLLNSDDKIDFIDSLRIKQTYTKAADSLWMPFNQTFLLHFSIFGVKIHGSYSGVFSNYNLHPDFSPHFFDGEIMKVNEDANKKDSTYWLANRPAPLTPAENKDYRKKDSISIVHGTKKYMDSVDLKNNTFGITDIFRGYSYYRRYNETQYGIGSILNFINYNTVEGWAPELPLYFNKRWEDNRNFSNTLTLRYGASNNLFSLKDKIYYLFNNMRSSSADLEGGKYVEQFNSDNPITPLINTAYTLIYKENFMKLYDNTFIKAHYKTELVNGIYLNAYGSYGLHSPLENSTNYTWADRPGVTFTSNYPYTASSQPNFTAYKALVFTAEVSFVIKQKYITRPHEKIGLGSKYPYIDILYKKGIPVLGSNQNFDQLQARINGGLKFGLFGNSEYSITGGAFLNNNSVGIAELKQFNGNQTIFASTDRMNSFELLPYYQFSTDRYYIEGHFEHHFGGFFLNKIPVLRKLKWYEVVGFHYLYTPDINYAEFSVGLEHVFKIFRFDFVSSYSNSLLLQSRFLIGVSTIVNLFY